MKPNPRMKEFVQVDAKGYDIPGTNRYFKRQPRAAGFRWRQITPQSCCSAFELLYEPSDVSDTSFTLTVTCNGSTLVSAIVEADVATVTIDDVAKLLRKKAGYVGKFSVDGTSLSLQLSSTIALQCADSADLAFTVVPTP